MKKIITLMLILILMFTIMAILLSGCGLKVDAEFAPYYTEAINSLLWCRGCSNNADRLTQPQIQILEQDSYGRVLFSYKEGHGGPSKLYKTSLHALLIAQAEDDNYVYYYDNNNYFCVEFDNYKEDAVKQQIAVLKADNDWNKDLELCKCIKKQKTTTRIKSDFNNKDVQSYFDKKREESNSSLLKIYPSAKDDHGRIIVSLLDYVDPIWQSRLSVCIVQPDGSIINSNDYGIEFDYFEYHESLAQLKEIANWDS